MRRGALSRALAVVLAVIVVAAVGGVVYWWLSTRGGGEVVIHFYTSMPKDIASEIVAKFEEKYPNIKVVLYRTGTSKLMAKLWTEIESGNVVADVIWVADPSDVIKLKKEGWLLKYVPPEAEHVPDEFKDPDGYWVAGRIIVEVIAYNTQIVKEPPKKWTDLIEPEWRATHLPSEWVNADGWCAMPDPMYSGAATATVYALVQKYGWEYFEKLKESKVAILTSNGKVRDALVAGQSAVGITLDYMIRQKKAEGLPVDYVFPEDGAIVIPSPIAIMKTTKHPEEAKLFVRFLLSKEVQEFLASKGIIPARTDVNPPPGVPPIDQIPKIKIDWETLAAKLEDIRKEFEQRIVG